MSSPTRGSLSLLGLDPASYRPHSLHAPTRTYIEINCYADIVIELLHARGEEPLAMMGNAVTVDFEGDQWTFLKPAGEDLLALYGIDVHEMQPYRALPTQIAEQIAAGRTITVELDAWFMPDTAATSYHSERVKSSIVPEAIDLENETLNYFHATGLHRLEGDDYRGILRLDGTAAGELPPYTELVRFDAGTPLRGGELHARARELLARNLSRAPRSNPFERFGEHLQRELPRLLAGDASDYHAYAFATVRMAGSAFEAADSHLQWLEGEAAEPARAPLQRIVERCKALSFKLARRRAFDPGPPISELAAAWDEAMARLDERV